MSKLSSTAQYFAGILAAYAILGLLFLVPGLLAGASTLVYTVTIIVAVVVSIFAAAIISKGLARLIINLRL